MAIDEMQYPAAPRPAMRAPGPVVPGAVTLVRVLLVIRAVVNVFWAFALVGMALLARQVVSALGPVDGPDLGLWGGVAVAFVLLLLIDSVVAIWANLAIRDGRPVGRTVLTVLPIVELVVCVALLISVGAETVDIAPLVVTSPLSLLVVPGVLWMSGSARRHFAGGHAAPYAGHLGGLDAPTVRFAVASGPTVGRGYRNVVVVAGVVTVLAVVGIGVTLLHTAGSTVTSAAVGTWRCTPPSASGPRQPYDVIISDGSFTIPDRRISGSWSLDGSGLSISATWTKTSISRTSTMQVSDVPASATTTSGTNPLQITSGTGRSRTQPLQWSYSPGRFSLSSGTGTAIGEVECAKMS